MGRSLEARLNGNGKDFIQLARDEGVSQAMKEYDVKDLIAAENYLKRHAPDEVFRYSVSEADTFAEPDRFDELVEAFSRCITNQKNQNAIMVAKYSDAMAENELLKKQLEKERKARWKKTRPIIENLMNMCKES